MLYSYCMYFSYYDISNRLSDREIPLGPPTKVKGWIP